MVNEVKVVAVEKSRPVDDSKVSVSDPSSSPRPPSHATV